MAVAPAAGPAAGLPSPMRSSLTATPSPRVDRPRALHGVPATDQSDPWRTVESPGTSTHSLTRPSSDRAADCPDFARAACICPLRRSGCRSPIPAGRGPSLGAGAGIYLAPLIGSGCVHLLPSLPHQHLLFPSRDQDCATASFLVLSWLTVPTPRPWAFRVAAVPGLRARPSPGPDSGLDGPGCLSAGLVPLAVQWPPAHAVVWPFGWRTLGVSGHGGRAVRRTPGPYTGRIEGPRARCTPNRSSSPAGVTAQP